MQWRQVLRSLPGILIVGITIIGLLFPDQIQWFASDKAPVPSPNAPHSPAASHPQVYAVIIFVLGLLALIASAIKDAKEQQNEPGHLSEEKFLEGYTESLATTLEYLPLVSIFSPDDRSDAVKNILRNIANVCEAYKSDTTEHRHSINACWYQATDPGYLSEPQLHDARRFMDKARTSYHTFLVLSEWAYSGGEAIDPTNSKSPNREKPCVDLGFTLPVDQDPQYTLAGAPIAFLEKKITVVPDISNEDAIKQLPGMNYAPIFNEMWRFFRDRDSYKSFVNLPVAVGNKVVGVVSIQSKMKHFCNLQSAHDQNMLQSMKPFLVALALLETYSSSS